MFGESEVRYLESARQRHAAERARRGVHPRHSVRADHRRLDAAAAAAGRLRALSTCRCCARPSATPVAIAKIGALLENALAVRQVMHGVLMDILGLGVLITGDSGIGKSECALDLVVRGHRLVADDAVEVRRRGETDLIGTCPELTRHHMEVRGLGVINIRDLFGVAATRMSKRMELVVQLERWDPAREYDRLGLEENVCELFGVKIPLVHMPVAPGPQPRDPRRGRRAESAAARRAA